MKKEILIGKNQNDLTEFAISMNYPKFRGAQIFNWIYKEKVDSIEKMSNLPKKIISELENKVQISSIKIEKIQESKLDGTIKFLFKLFDDKNIETVLIPPRETALDSEKRLTICVSTQVGCPLDCKFCATGTMKFERNLTAGEIIEQVILVEKFVNKKITNVVFMGMGEPMLNYDQVFLACDILTDQNGMSISAKKITISTSGFVDGIKKMADDNRKEKLAISLHSLDNKIREELMPITKKYPIENLVEALKYYYKKTEKNIMFEYILFKDLNDRDEDIRFISKLSNSVPCRINVIPFHDISFTNSNNKTLIPASKDEINLFSKKLRAKNVLVFTRNSSGIDIDAACGQLAIKKNKKIWT